MIERFWREFGRAKARFRHMPLSVLPGLVARAVRLQLADPPLRPAPRRPERVVVTLTTTPARLPHIAPALRSLLDQDEPADRVILAWPDRSRRTGERYPEPDTVRLPAGVDVLRCEDEGPATKLLRARAAEPGAVLVVADDDVLYPGDFLATLLCAHRRAPAEALGYRGVRLAGKAPMAELPHVMATGIHEPRPVDVLFGTWGYLLPPDSLDDAVADFSGWPEEVRMVDDIWISAHLARRGVTRRVIPALRMPLETMAAWRGALSSGPNRSGDNDRVALAALASCWTAPSTGGQR